VIQTGYDIIKAYHDECKLEMEEGRVRSSLPGK